MLSDKPDIFVFIKIIFDETYQSLMEVTPPRGYYLSNE
jgi:hypothetical protein